MQLNGKWILITGAGSGIGRALSFALSQEGAKLVLCGRRLDALEETQKSLPKGSESILLPIDITSSEDRQRLTDQIEKHCQTLDMLINNAGIVKPGELKDLSDKDLNNMLQTNLAAPIALTRDLLSLMTAGQGHVVNIGSMFGDIAFPLFAAYSASKFGLRGFSDALRRELSPKGIGVTYVAPRATRTPAANDFAHLEKAFDMTFDAPEAVAEHIVNGLKKDKNNIYPKGPERLFAFVQKICPRLIDKNLVSQFSVMSD